MDGSRLIRCRASVIVVFAGCFFFLASHSAHAQGTSGPIVSDSVVGYIDNAIPGNYISLRYDTAYNNRRPTRAEFFYARSGAAGGPGLPLPEKSVDYQDLIVHAETLLTPNLSAFVELGPRFLNPEVNDNSAGLGDMNAGFKWAFFNTDYMISSFQLRTYIPTGDADRGLGTHHVSLEPGFLTYLQLTDRLALDGEFRCWIPVADNQFAGDIIRYGVGLQYFLVKNESWYVAPVAEFVGWTVLDGQENAVSPFGINVVEDAAGDTIVNVKLGARAGIRDRFDLYAGWGRPLTGDRWYENIFRVELRWFY